MKSTWCPFQVIVGFISLLLLVACQPVKPLPEEEGAALEYRQIVINEEDPAHGSYVAVLPQVETGQTPEQLPTFQGAIVLLPGFGQGPESIWAETELEEYAAANQLLTIGFAGRTHMTADELILNRMEVVLSDAIERFGLDPKKFAIGGFSAGGTIALRYAELCHQFPDSFPISPQAVFLADAPIDMYRSWSTLAENIANAYSEIAVNEGLFVQRYLRQFYGATPEENPERYRELSPFSIDTSWGNNEVSLQDVAVRTYHDVDIAWRINNRNQTVRQCNYLATAEMINRLNLLGNERAEFIQTMGTGMRANGERHPHAWSVIEEAPCIDWILDSFND